MSSTRYRRPDYTCPACLQQGNVWEAVTTVTVEQSPEAETKSLGFFCRTPDCEWQSPSPPPVAPKNPNNQS